MPTVTKKSMFIPCDRAPLPSVFLRCQSLSRERSQQRVSAEWLNVQSCANEEAAKRQGRHVLSEKRGPLECPGLTEPTFGAM